MQCQVDKKDQAGPAAQKRETRKVGTKPGKDPLQCAFRAIFGTEKMRIPEVRAHKKLTMLLFWDTALAYLSCPCCPRFPAPIHTLQVSDRRMIGSWQVEFTTHRVTAAMLEDSRLTFQHEIVILFLARSLTLHARNLSQLASTYVPVISYDLIRLLRYPIRPSPSFSPSPYVFIG